MGASKTLQLGGKSYHQCLLYCCIFVALALRLVAFRLALAHGLLLCCTESSSELAHLVRWLSLEIHLCCFSLCLRSVHLCLSSHSSCYPLFLCAHTVTIVVQGIEGRNLFLGSVPGILCMALPSSVISTCRFCCFLGSVPGILCITLPPSVFSTCRFCACFQAALKLSSVSAAHVCRVLPLGSPSCGMQVRPVKLFFRSVYWMLSNKLGCDPMRGAFSVRRDKGNGNGICYFCVPALCYSICVV
jgi:hypothetical protein